MRKRKKKSLIGWTHSHCEFRWGIGLDVGLVSSHKIVWRRKDYIKYCEYPADPTKVRITIERI